MGCPDTIYGPCPFCEKEYNGQTKQFGNACLAYKIGDRVAADSISMRLELKHCCPSCGETPVAVVKNGVLLCLEKDSPELIEECWGKLSLPKKPDNP